MIQSLQLASVPIPEDVRAFAEEQGVGKELPLVLELTQRVFPKATLTVRVVDDPEIPNDRHIVMFAEGVDEPASEGLDKLSEWHQGLFDCCPAPRVCVFTISVRGFR